MSVGVVARLTVQSGKESEFERIFSDLQAQVREKEDGCLYYDLYRSKESANVYVVMECYADQEALDVHGKSEYFRSAQPALGSVLDMSSPPEITYYDHVN